MKRCPRCNRVETDEALKFCRVDGTTLVTESTPLNPEAGTAPLGTSPNEAHTSILPHRTDAGISRATGPTTALPPPPPATTGTLAKAKSRQPIVIAVIVTAAFAVVTAIVVNSYLSRKSATAITSIAVLPFANATGDKEVEFLSEGLAETLINNFTRIPELKVTARSTAFRYRGREAEPQVVGRELGVGSVLTGKLLQRGDTLSIQVDLINTSDGVQIWGNRYEGKTTDIVHIQQKIASDVSAQLKLKLTGAQQQQLAKNYTQNAEAYQLYLKGRFYWNRRTAENIQKAIVEFEAAADKDPNYALAYVGLADCYLLLQEYAGTPESETRPRAKAYVERALAIDSALAEAHVSLASIKELSWEWAEAEKEYKRAIELNPNYPTARHWYSRLLRALSRYDEALAEIKRAQELDPLSTVINSNVATLYILKGDYAAAVEQGRRIIEIDPSSHFGYLALGRTYLSQGRTAEAIVELEKAVKLGGRSQFAVSLLGDAYGIAGKRDEATAILKELEGRYVARQAAGVSIAEVLVGLGQKDEALAWLEKDFKARSGYLVSITQEPEYRALRDDPRFKDLVRRMGLPESK